MNWKHKIHAAVLSADFCSGAGHWVWEDFEQTHCRGTFYRDPVSDVWVWVPGRILFSGEYFNPYHSFISFISNACPWGRRHQNIFHDRKHTYNRRIVQMYGVQCCCSGRRSGVFSFGGLKPVAEAAVCGRISAG